METNTEGVEVTTEGLRTTAVESTTETVRPTEVVTTEAVRPTGVEVTTETARPTDMEVTTETVRTTGVEITTEAVRTTSEEVITEAVSDNGILEYSDESWESRLHPKKTNQTDESEAVIPAATEAARTTTELHESTEEEEGGTTVSHPLEGSEDDETNSGVVIAIVISSIGAVCLVVLAGLLFLMRRRQKHFNYGQKCTPVSLDAYSMNNVSVYNSVRRKAALRGSKRSYGNPTFDDASVSHTLNFQTLVKFATNLEDIKREFEEIPTITARMNELPEGCEIKNRYANVIPLPETRVILSRVDDDPTGDYINANYITGPKGVRGYYIACQAPLANTVNDFWRMIWEQQSKVVLMLTHLYENGMKKCIDDLPPSEVLDCHRLFGDYQVTLKKGEAKDILYLAYN